jgi:hypothetical protein
MGKHQREILVTDKEPEETFHVYAHGSDTFKHRRFFSNNGMYWEEKSGCWVREFIPTKRMADLLKSYVRSETNNRVAAVVAPGPFMGLDLTKVNLSPREQSEFVKARERWVSLADRYRSILFRREKTGDIDEAEACFWDGLICVLEDPNAKPNDKHKVIETLAKFSGIDVKHGTKKQEEDEAEEAAGKPIGELLDRIQEKGDG